MNCTRSLRLTLLLVLLGTATALAGQSEDADPGLELISVTVEPGAVRADTLCKLSVEVANRGQETADAFAFEVLVAGQQLAIYDGQLFLDPIPAGATRTLQLFNFWSNEEGRELPSAGALKVEVRLRAALWVRVEEQDGAQVWTSEGPVEGLPVSGSASLDIER